MFLKQSFLLKQALHSRSYPYFFTATKHNITYNEHPVTIPVITNKEYGNLFVSCKNASTVTQVHAQILARGQENNLFLATKLTHSYSNHGKLQNADMVFEKSQEKNNLLFNAIIKAYSWHGQHEKALVAYKLMQECSAMAGDNYTFSSLLKSCGVMPSILQGQMIHVHVLKNGLHTHVFVGNALTNMYAKCGDIGAARLVFDFMPSKDTVTWNAMASGYVQSGLFSESLRILPCMIGLGTDPDYVTISNILPACGACGELRPGACIHSYAIRKGFSANMFVMSALIDMYAKCGCTDLAKQVFDEMPSRSRDVVSWNSMISGYVNKDKYLEAISMFDEMLKHSMAPDSVTVSCVVSACARLGALEKGRAIHDYVKGTHLLKEISAANALIDMYAKCGVLESARELFDNMLRRDIVSWNTIIAGYGSHGYGEKALELFYQMRDQDMRPSNVTFIHLLCACSHAGLVNEGQRFFGSMSKDYGIIPSIDHYACMVDLLGRAGQLNEALDFVKKMPLEVDDRIWGTLLSACRNYQNLEVAEVAGKELFDKVGTKVSGYYVLLSNMYAEAGKCDGIAKMRRMMKEKGLKKIAGCSMVELNGRIHAFSAEDTSHPQTEEIYTLLRILYKKMKMMGYQSNIRFWYHDVGQSD